MQTVTNSNTQTVNTQTVNTQTVNTKLVQTLQNKFKIKMPSGATANYIKNTVSHNGAKNKVNYALICVGQNKFYFIGTGANVILPSGKKFKITQITHKNSNQKGNKLTGLQPYFKWATNNGLFSGGNFSVLKGLQYKIALSTKKTPLTATANLTYKQALSANINNVPTKYILNMPKQTPLNKA